MIKDTPAASLGGRNVMVWVSLFGFIRDNTKLT